MVKKIGLTASGVIPGRMLNELINKIRNGRCIVLPADTCYIFVVDPLNENAAQELFDIKKRPIISPIHVCVATMAQAKELAVIEPKAERVLENFTPGPITVVMRKREIVPDVLVANTGTIGIRIPDSPCILQFCAELGGPITATSVNFSNNPALDDPEEIIRTFGERIDSCVIGNKFHYTKPSTVVKIIDGSLEFLRDGAIERERITEAAKSLSYCDVRDWT